MRRRRDHSRLRLELRRSRLALAIYALIVVLGLAGYAIIFRNQDVRWAWEDTTEVRVEFDHVKGVVPGLQQARIAGVPVGKIEAVERSGSGAVATISIDSRYAPVYRDAKVRLRPATPLEDQYVDIVDRGTPGAGELGAGEVLSASQTIAPVDIGRLLDVFDVPTRTRLRALLESFERGLGHEGGVRLRQAFAEISPFLDEFSRLTRVLARHRNQTKRLISNARLMATALGERDRQIEGIVSDGAGVLGVLAAAGQPLDATIHELPPLLAAMRTSFAGLSALADDLDPALAKLGPIAERLPAGLQAGRRLAAAGTPALDALRPALARLRPVASALDPALGPLSTGLERLAGQTPGYERIAAEAADCTLAIGKFFQWTASVLKYYDAWGTYPRGELVVGSHAVRGQTPDPFIKPNEGCTRAGDDG